MAAAPCRTVVTGWREMLRGARRRHLGFARFAVEWLSRGARLAQQNEWMRQGWPGKSSLA